MWALDNALTFIRSNQPAAMDAGYYLALAGGVLNKGFSTNDLDVVAVPRQQQHSRKELLSLFPGVQPSGRVYAATVYEIKADQVDLIIIDSEPYAGAEQC